MSAFWMCSCKLTIVLRTIEVEGYPLFGTWQTHVSSFCHYIRWHKSWKSDPSAPRPWVGRSDPEAGSKPSSRVPQHLRKWEEKGWWSETSSWLYNNSIQWYWLWKRTCLHFRGWSLVVVISWFSLYVSKAQGVPILESLSVSLIQGFPGTLFLETHGMLWFKDMIWIHALYSIYNHDSHYV